MSPPTSPSPAEETPAVPDYALSDSVVADTPQQLKALGDGMRLTILGMLAERAATTSQLAEALERPKGTVGYHLKVLEAAGLIKVVRTAKKRAMTEKYYGRVGRTILMQGPPSEKDPFLVLREAMREAVIHGDEPLPMFTLRRARVPLARAVEFADRVVELADEFAATRRSGDTVYGFVGGLFPTNQPVLKPEDEQ